jgi:hypothetical protein
MACLAYVYVRFVDPATGDSVLPTIKLDAFKDGRWIRIESWKYRPREHVLCAPMYYTEDGKFLAALGPRQWTGTADVVFMRRNFVLPD